MRCCWACVLLVLLTLGAKADEKIARQTLEKSVTALGGAKNLADAQAFTFRVKGTVEVNGQRSDVAGEWSLSGLDRYRWGAEATNPQGQITRLTLAGEGAKAWIAAENGQPNDLPLEIGTALHHSLRALRLAQNPAILLGKEFTLSSLGELKIGQRDTTGVKIQQKGFPDVDVFFDRKSALPVKCEVRIKETKDGMDVGHSYLLDDFKQTGELKQCTRLRFLRDDTTHLELELSDVKGQARLDDSLFAKPPKQ